MSRSGAVRERRSCHKDIKVQVLSSSNGEKVQAEALDPEHAAERSSLDSRINRYWFYCQTDFARSWTSNKILSLMRLKVVNLAGYSSAGVKKSSAGVKLQHMLTSPQMNP